MVDIPHLCSPLIPARGAFATDSDTPHTDSSQEPHPHHFAGAQRAGQIAGEHQRPMPGGDELCVLGIFKDAGHLVGVIVVEPGQCGAGEEIRQALR